MLEGYLKHAWSQSSRTPTPLLTGVETNLAFLFRADSLAFWGTTELLSFQKVRSAVSVFRNFTIYSKYNQNIPCSRISDPVSSRKLGPTTFLRKFVYAGSTICYLFVIPQCCKPYVGRHTFMRLPVGKCTCNVTLRAFAYAWLLRKTINITYSGSVSVVFLYSMPCLCAILYCRVWPVRLYHIFQHYLINDTIFGKKYLLNISRVLIFSINFVQNISHSTNNWTRYYHKCISVFM
jgi:hypothetical protein